MADVKKLRSDIQKLKKALQAKGVSKTVKDKLQVQLDKAESELAASKKPAKSAKPKKSTPLNRLQSLVKKKKYSAYSKAGVDLKKDAGQPALPTGKRTSKSGKTYYEYRANRIDVKQPPKRYPKLEDGGKTAKIDEVSSMSFRNQYDDYEMIVISKEAEKDGGNIVKDRYLVSAKDINEAKEITEKLWRKQYADNDLSIVKIMSDSLYKLKYSDIYADGGYMAEGEDLSGNLYKVHFLKVFEDGKEGDTVFVKEVYAHTEKEALSNFKKMYPKRKIEYISKYKDGGEMNKDTFSNIFLSNGFSERKSFDGIRFFVNKKHKYDNKIIYSTVDLSNKKVIIEDEDGKIYYEGFSVLGVIEGLKKLGFEKGGMMAEGGETSDDKIRFDMYGYIHANDRKQDGDEIIRVSSYKEAEEKAEKFLKKNKYELVELYRKDDFVGSIRTEKNFVYSSRYKKEDFSDGGMMAEGGQVKWLLQRDNGEEWVKYDKYKSGLNAYKLTPTKELAVEFDKREDAEKLINDLQKELDASLIVVRLKMADGGYMADGGEIEVGDKVKYKNAKYHATVLKVFNDVEIPYAIIDYETGTQPKKAYLEDLQKVELRMAKEYVNPDYMAEGGETEKMALGGATVSTQYEKVEGTDYELKIKVYYDKGGISYATYKQEPRGYYLSVSPVQREKRDGYTVESYMAFSGVKTLLLPVQRQSPKAEKQAQEIAEKMMPEMKSYISDKVKEKAGFMKGGGYMAEGGMIKIEEDAYGKSAYIPYKGETFLLEWNTERPTKDSTVISDRSFRRLDEDSSLYQHLLVTLLKAMHENKVQYAEEGAKLAKGGYMAEGGVMSTTHRLSK